jgi:SAM-dependent methyltransferase
VTVDMRIVDPSSPPEQAPSAAAGHRCPACRTVGSPFRSSEAIGVDLADLARAHAPDGSSPPLKLMHREAAPIEGCEGCGGLWRAEASLWRDAVDSYRDDDYTPDLLAALHCSEVQQASRDRRWLTTQGVSKAARLLEVACYVGGFLSFADSTGASILGVDPNPLMVEWCRQHGLDAMTGTLEELALPAASFDGVWILNCFDQVPDPNRLLHAVRCVVRDGGRLIIRTPNASFLRAAYAVPADHRLRRVALQQVLWGMPHLCCYTLSGLINLMGQHDFSPWSVRPRPPAADRSVTGRALAPWIDFVAVAGARPTDQ